MWKTEYIYKLLTDYIKFNRLYRPPTFFRYIKAAGQIILITRKSNTKEK